MRALILDFDGTILDTETPEVETWREIYREHGHEFPDSWWQNAIGRGADQIEEWPGQMLSRWLNGKVSSETLEAERTRRYYARLDASDTREGILEVLAHSADAGIPVAIASSSKHVWINRHLDKRGLRSHFHTVVCADDVPRAKPFPDLYHLALEKLGVREALAIEDSPNGIRAAREAGVTVYAFANPLTSILDLSHAHASIDRADHPLVLDWLNRKPL